MNRALSVLVLTVSLLHCADAGRQLQQSLATLRNLNPDYKFGVAVGWIPENNSAGGRYYNMQNSQSNPLPTQQGLQQGIPQHVVSILNNKRQRASVTLQIASEVLGKAASNLRSEENSGLSYDQTYNYPSNSEPSSGVNYFQSFNGNHNPSPVVIVQSPQIQNTVPLSQQVPVQQSPMHQGFAPQIPLSQTAPSQYPSDMGFNPSTTVQHSSSSSNGEKESELTIPVASGGIEPPKDYNTRNPLIVVDNLPWMDQTQTNHQSVNNFPELQSQGSNGFGSAGTVANPNQNNNNFGHIGNKAPIANTNNFGTSQKNPPNPPANSGFGNSDFSIIESIQIFTLDLLATFRNIGYIKNVVFSPVSITSLLSLLTLGAKGETKHEIEVALNLPTTYSSDSQHKGYEDILRRLNHMSQGVTVTTSSRLFLEEKMPIYGSFTDKAAQHYNCSVSLENFRRRPIRTLNRVNRWVESETQGKIKKFIEQPFGPETLFVAVNTIFFKGDWKTPFDKHFTNLRDFDTGTKVVQVPMMVNVFETPHYYSERLDVDIVSVPYLGDEFSLFVILPRASPQVKSIETLEFELDTFLIDDLIYNMTSKQVSLSLPKMRMSMKTSLTHSLSQLNIQNMFSPSLADFSGITNTKPLWVGNILHEAVVEINEVGTIAAAASAAALDRFGGFDRVNVNKPAIIFIRDMVTGLPLFWTRLMKPDPLE